MKRRKDDTAAAKPSEARASRSAGLELIADPVKWAKALEDFAAAELGPSSRSSLDARLVTAEQFVKAANKLPLLPVTADKLRTLGAVLRGVFYKSAPEVLRVVKAEHVASDLEWPGSLERAFNRCLKACRRGRGPVKRAGLGDI